MLCFFFCKQNTAYEMRISDWISDVCSSDLSEPANAINSTVLSTTRPRPRAWKDKAETGASRPNGVPISQNTAIPAIDARIATVTPCRGSTGVIIGCSCRPTEPRPLNVSSGALSLTTGTDHSWQSEYGHAPADRLGNPCHGMGQTRGPGVPPKPAGNTEVSA